MAGIKDFFLIFIGGGLGSLARFAVSKTFNPYLSLFPLGTFLSNLVASFILGFFFIYVQQKAALFQIVPTLVMIGFCGGFSTFSTFSYDNFALLKSGNYVMFGLNIFLNVAVCIIGVFLGMKSGEALLR